MVSNPTSREEWPSLRALARAGELLDETLEPIALLDLALDISLQAVRADTALLAIRGERGDTARLRPRDGDVTSTPELVSRLALRALETGEPGIQRDASGPGARALIEVLGQPPAVRIAVPLARNGPPFGVLEVAYREDPHVGLEAEERTLQEVARHLAISLDYARLRDEQERRVAEFGHLVDIAGKISAHLDLQEVLHAIVASVGELIPSDAVGLFLIDQESRLIREERLQGYDASRVEDARLKVGRGILGWVADAGEGIIVNDVRHDERYVPARDATRSEMATPLRYDGRVIGVFNLESDQPGAFRARDLELLESFASHAAISIMNAHLHTEARAMRRLEEQLRVARRIQEMLLPDKAPSIEGHTLAGRNLPSSAVGGDWFDFRRQDDGQWAIIIADVSGNGIPAAIIMAGFRAETRAALRRTSDPSQVLREVNDVLAVELDPDYFVTAFLGLYDPRTGALRYANAGHEPALLVRAAGGTPERLSQGGLLLGVFAGVDYDQAMVHLAPGDRLLLYTDGLSDAADGPAEDSTLGEEGILRLLAAEEAAGTDWPRVPERMLQSADEAAAVRPDEMDDRTLVLLRRDPRSSGTG